ncbi:DUF1269 domain-containing protein [Sphingomonas canadensis]|uniref:DUF1269 domain-containing protein n=1 Tax=Sphingomonas canadensis TaxID=1219257 RepID=A0ABW3HDN1_9SPHN|nr:DUF1269 domain-containing protein [Sphingomonas canadensis]MCW3837323.1 DUF1269 domain-containing protein [Sphingomonas canadensis]
MSELVVIAFDNEEKAEEIRDRLVNLQRSHIVALADAVVATKRSNGSIRLSQLVSPATSGAISGGFWGLLIGALFLAPHIGLLVGAASGGLAGALTDVGVDDDFMREVADVLQPGSAALFVLIQKMTEDKLLDELKGVGGKVLRTSLDHTKEEQLREALAGALRQEAAQPA